MPRRFHVVFYNATASWDFIPWVTQTLTKGKTSWALEWGTYENAVKVQREYDGKAIISQVVKKIKRLKCQKDLSKDTFLSSQWLKREYIFS